jgi:hypothetical protein
MDKEFMIKQLKKNKDISDKYFDSFWKLSLEDLNKIIDLVKIIKKHKKKENNSPYHKAQRAKKWLLEQYPKDQDLLSLAIKAKQEGIYSKNTYTKDIVFSFKKYLKALGDV